MSSNKKEVSDSPLCMSKQNSGNCFLETFCNKRHKFSWKFNKVYRHILSLYLHQTNTMVDSNFTYKCLR